MKKMVLSGVALGMMSGPALAGQPVVLTAAELDRVAAGNSVDVTTAVVIDNANINQNTNTATATASVTTEAFDDSAILAALLAIQADLDLILNP